MVIWIIGFYEIKKMNLENAMYKKITEKDLLLIATEEEKNHFEHIFDIYLLKELALRWCKKNDYKLGGYLGHSKKDGACWDAIKNPNEFARIFI